MLAVDVVVFHRLHDRFPSFGFDLLARAGAAVIIGGHLREDAIAQAERRIAEPFEVEAVQQFVVDSGPSDNNFCAARADALDFAAFGDRETS